MPHPLFDKLRIFAPGPTPVPPEALEALSRPPLHHRTPEFTAILNETREDLKYLFQTTQEAYLLAGSGTAGMEATITNLFDESDKVLVVDGGKFGERWGKIAAAFGLNVETISVPWGSAVDPSQIQAKLSEHKDICAVLFQASETSTGVYHPVKEIAETVHKNSDALVIVDAITALGVCELPMDKWGLDVVVGGSQKALMLPPGLACLAMSERARNRRKSVKGRPRFYLNLDAEDKALVKSTTAWTPAVGLIMGLNVILKRFREKGLQSVFDHHAKIAEATRMGVQAMGLDLFAPESPSPAVTAVKVPTGVDGKKIVSHIRNRFGITIAGGQDDYTGKIFRVGHLGYYDELDILTVLAAVEISLVELGYSLELGKGVGAAAKHLSEGNR